MCTCIPLLHKDLKKIDLLKLFLRVSLAEQSCSIVSCTRIAEKKNLLLCKFLAMTSLGVFALFYCFLSLAEQFSLPISIKYNIPNSHATLISDCLMLREKLKEGKLSQQVIFK